MLKHPLHISEREPTGESISLLESLCGERLEDITPEEQALLEVVDQRLHFLLQNKRPFTPADLEAGNPLDGKCVIFLDPNGEQALSPLHWDISDPSAPECRMLVTAIVLGLTAKKRIMDHAYVNHTRDIQDLLHRIRNNYIGIKSGQYGAQFLLETNRKSGRREIVTDPIPDLLAELPILTIKDGLQSLYLEGRLTQEKDRYIIEIMQSAFGEDYTFNPMIEAFLLAISGFKTSEQAKYYLKRRAGTQIEDHALKERAVKTAGIIGFLTETFIRDKRDFINDPSLTRQDFRLLIGEYKNFLTNRLGKKGLKRLKINERDILDTTQIGKILGSNRLMQLLELQQYSLPGRFKIVTQDVASSVAKRMTDFLAENYPQYLHNGSIVAGRSRVLDMLQGLNGTLITPHALTLYKIPENLEESSGSNPIVIDKALGL